MMNVQAHVSYRVPYTDSDQMGVVYYANYLVYFERARNDLLRKTGFPYADLEQRGYALPVLEAHVNYRSAARYDDVLDIIGWIGWVRPVRLQVNCRVCRGDTTIAEGHTIHAFVARETLRPTRMPKDLAEAFGGAAAEG